MMRPHWYQDGPRRPFGFASLRTWSGPAILVALLVACYLVQLLIPAFERFLRFEPAEMHNPLQWYRLLTYALLHDPGSLMHLLFNCLGLWFFGQGVQAEFGSRRAFFVFCAAAAVVACLSFAVAEAFRAGAAPPLIGASGMVFAVLVAFAVLFPNATVIFFIFPMRAWVLVTLFLLINLFSQIKSPDSGVAYMAHLGGGAFGFVAIRFRHRLDAWRHRLQSRLDARRRAGDRQKREQLDRLLEKIHREGMSSLSRAEKRFLHSASRKFRVRD